MNDTYFQVFMILYFLSKHAMHKSIYFLSYQGSLKVRVKVYYSVVPGSSLVRGILIICMQLVLGLVSLVQLCGIGVPLILLYYQLPSGEVLRIPPVEKGRCPGYKVCLYRCIHGTVCSTFGYIVHQADWRLHISWFYFKLERTPAGLCVTSFGFLQFK